MVWVVERHACMPLMGVSEKVEIGERVIEAAADAAENVDVAVTALQQKIESQLRVGGILVAWKFLRRHLVSLCPLPLCATYRIAIADEKIRQDVEPMEHLKAGVGCHRVGAVADEAAIEHILVQCTACGDNYREAA